MTANRNIYVDMDDVLCETCRGFLKLLQSEFNRCVAYEDVKEFDLSKSFSMNFDEIEKFMERAHHPDILAALIPLPGAIEAIQNWVDSDYKIDIMTGRPPSTRVYTEKWLKRHEVDYNSLNFVDKYGRREFDSSFCEALTLADLAEKRFCLAVEDSAATAGFLAENEVAPVVLIDRPWNRIVVNDDIRRMTDWQELARVCSTPDI
jgi:uncharacterized HAD superfamily protein